MTHEERIRGRLDRAAVKFSAELEAIGILANQLQYYIEDDDDTMTEKGLRECLAASLTLLAGVEDRWHAAFTEMWAAAGGRTSTPEAA